MRSLLRILLLLFLVQPLLSPAQSFEGTITYFQDADVSAAFKKMGLTKEMLLEDLRKKGSWFDTLKAYYRQGDYAHVGNGEQRITKIYLASENKIYGFHAIGEDKCGVFDAVDLDFNGAPDKPLVTELDSTVTVMGLPCKIIRFKWKLTQVDYYYNATQARVNPDLFSKHSTEGFAEFVKRTKCLPLRVITGGMGVNMIRTATAVKPGKVNPDVFKIPVLAEDETLNIIKLPGMKMMRIVR